ncbi:unnamed protein product, partial [Sphagnum compactum]
CSSSWSVACVGMWALPISFSIAPLVAPVSSTLIAAHRWRVQTLGTGFATGADVQARSLKKLVKQKSLPGSRNHVSSSIPVPSKRLSSLKSMPHTKSVAIIDSPKGLVRRYKSLSDISY